MVLHLGGVSLPPSPHLQGILTRRVNSLSVSYFKDKIKRKLYNMVEGKYDEIVVYQFFLVLVKYRMVVIAVQES